MHIDLLLTDRKYYTYEGYAAHQVRHILDRLSIAHQTYYLSDGILHNYLFHATDSPTDWTLGFANLTPYQKPLCDLLALPHFYWVGGSLGPAYHYLESEYGYLGLPDLTLSTKISHRQALFLPQGVLEERGGVKQFDVVLFADLIDLPFLERTWRELFDDSVIHSIRESIEKKEPLHAKQYLFYAEQYLKAHKTLQQVAALKEIKLHLFGEHAGNNWLTKLPEGIHLHSLLPYTEYFEVLKMSRICIAEPDSPWYLPAIANESLPLPADEKQIRYYLSHPKEREKELEKLKTKLSEWTWEKQVIRLIEYLQNESQRYYTHCR